MFHFYFETPNIADWISVTLTVIGLGIAFYVMNQWKKEKEYDIVIEALTKSQKAIEYLRIQKLQIAMKSNKILLDSRMLNNRLATKMHLNHIGESMEGYKDIQEEILIIYEKLTFSATKKDSTMIYLYTKILYHLSKHRRSESEIMLKLSKISISEFEILYDPEETKEKIANVFSQAYMIEEHEIDELKSLRLAAEKEEKVRWNKNFY